MSTRTSIPTRPWQQPTATQKMKTSAIFMASLLLVTSVYGATPEANEVIHRAEKQRNSQPSVEPGASSGSELASLPLHVAAFNGYLPAVDNLLTAGTSHTVLNEAQQTPLHLAAGSGRVNVLERLLQECTCGDTPAPTLHSDRAGICRCRNEYVNAEDSDGRRPLHYAANKGHLDAMHFLIQNGADIRARDIHGLAAIHQALAGGQFDAAKRLFDMGINVNEKYSQGETLLHFEISNYIPGMITSLISIGADRNATRDDGFTPAWLATILDNVDALKELILDQRDANATFSQGLTLLHYAAMLNRPEAVKILIEKGANHLKNDASGIIPFQYAITNDASEAIQAFISNGTGVNDEFDSGFTPLMLAVAAGKFKSAEILIANDADVNRRGLKGFAPLHVASQVGSVAMTELLFKHGADVSTVTNDGLTPLHVAVVNGKSDVAEFLIQHGADVSSEDKYRHTVIFYAKKAREGMVEMLILNEVDMSSKCKNTVLHEAVLNDKVGDIDQLVAQGNSIHAKNGVGNAPLHSAVSAGNVAAIKALMRLQANVNAKNDLGNCPLHMATNVAAVETLVQLGADLRERNAAGHTPLHVAAGQGRLGVVESLFAAGALVNASDANGKTALHLAVLRGHFGVVLFLASKGANWLARDYRDMTPLMCAFTKKHDQRIISFLLQIEQGLSLRDEEMIVKLADEHGVYIDRTIMKDVSPAVEALMAKLAHRRKASSNTECAICRDSLTEEGFVVHLSCGHEFCEECMLAQIESGDPVCGLCRKDFSVQSDAIVSYSKAPSNGSVSDEYAGRERKWADVPIYHDYASFKIGTGDQFVEDRCRRTHGYMIAALLFGVVIVAGLVLEIRFSLLDKLLASIRARNASRHNAAEGLQEVVMQQASEPVQEHNTSQQDTLSAPT